MRNKLLSVFLILWLLSSLQLPAMAQQLEDGPEGSISVTLAAPESGQPMAGAELSVYHVASAGISLEGNLNYSYTNAFAECGFPLDDPSLTEKLGEYVSAHAVASRKVVTDGQGKALCEDLPLGLYFVQQTGAVSGFAPCTPFLVTVPMKTDSGYQYHVDASPKTDVVRYADITVKKVWNTGSTSGIPASVKVQLLRGSEVVETAVLSARNNWQITYRGLPESDSYSIEELNVPQGYTATYSRSGNVFTVTNTPALAQTGQITWPIPVFALAGLLLLMAGLVILRKPGKQDA